MKALKIYLAIVTTLLVVALGFGVYVWYTVQKLNATLSDSENATEFPSVSDTAEIQVKDTVSESIVIDTGTLTPTQQKLLDTVGFTQETLTITPSMITCAQNAVGKDRITQIIDGDAPTLLESVKLLPCVKK